MRRVLSAATDIFRDLKPASSTMVEVNSRDKNSDVSIVSPGFSGRRRSADDRLPPGQYLTHDFPVLSAGPTQRVTTAQWEFTITTEAGQAHRWSWSDLMNLTSEEI